jgi:proteasome assembly chaperone (PAC2) family protein
VTDFDGLPVLRTPVAVAAFEGWNDAADASTAAVEHLEDVWAARPVTALDPEDFYDLQVSRPILTLVDDARHIEWPTTRFAAASPPGADRDVVLIRGIEPSMRWRTFCDQILEVCHALEINRVVLLGALLADVPHTRPVNITGAATDADLIARLGLTRSRYEGPTGIVGVLHDACREGGVASASLWAPVPHYVATPPNPLATRALLERLGRLVGVPLQLDELDELATAWQQRVDDVVAEDDDVRAYVRKLEERAELQEIDETEMTSGDDLAAELERFLREEGRD